MIDWQEKLKSDRAVPPQQQVLAEAKCSNVDQDDSDIELMFPAPDEGHIDYSVKLHVYFLPCSVREVLAWGNGYSRYLYHYPGMHLTCMYSMKISTNNFETNSLSYMFEQCTFLVLNKMGCSVSGDTLQYRLKENVCHRRTRLVTQLFTYLLMHKLFSSCIR